MTSGGLRQHVLQHIKNSTRKLVEFADYLHFGKFSFEISVVYSKGLFVIAEPFISQREGNEGEGAMFFYTSSVKREIWIQEAYIGQV